MVRERKNSVLLVDSINISFRWFKKTSWKGLSTQSVQAGFAREYEEAIRGFANSFNCDKIIVCSDSGGSTYRKEIYPEYKAGRPRTPESKIFIDNVREAEDSLSKDIPLLRYRGIEADDLFTCLVAKFTDYNFTILSTDRDLEQLVSDRVDIFSYINNKHKTNDNFKDETGYYVESVVPLKVLCGDKSDNIPGISGVGVKRALTLLDKYGLDIWDWPVLKGNSQYIKNTNNFINSREMSRNYMLMDLLEYNSDIINTELRSELISKSCLIGD